MSDDSSPFASPPTPATLSISPPSRATMSVGARSRPPPPPLRLHQTSFASTPPPPPRSMSRDRGDSTGTPLTPNSAKLLYELPPSSSSPRLRAAQLQQEKAKVRATLNTQYRLQQASAISSKSPQNLEHDTLPPQYQGDLDIGSPMTPTGGAGRYSVNGPPSARPRSVTPSFHPTLMSPVRSDLEAFALQCKAWFFAQDAAAGKAMTSTLASLPPNQKATYTKLQASVRSAYHTWTSLRRLQEFRALLASITPGGSLTPAARAVPLAPQARKERVDQFTQFVRTQCSAGAPGTHPFFKGLCAILRLQSLNASAGGAGGARIEWEIDDGVFLESGGKEFMVQAIETMKGVLGFEEYLPSTEGVFEPPYPLDPNHEDSDTDSSLLEDGRLQVPTSTTQSPIVLSKPPPPRVAKKTSFGSSSDLLNQSPSPVPRLGGSSAISVGQRSRSSSDPFSDPGGSSPGQGPSSSYLSRATVLSGIGEGGDEKTLVDQSPVASNVPLPHTRHQSQPLPMSSSSRLNPQQLPGSNSYGPSTPVDEFPPTSPSYATFHQNDFDLDVLLSTESNTAFPYKPPTQTELDLLHTPQLRVWTFPAHITNHEITMLLEAFPPFILKATVPPKFTPPSTQRKGDLEEGVVKSGDVSVGTGRMWIGEKTREDKWQAGLWTRFVLWLKHMFA